MRRLTILSIVVGVVLAVQLGAAAVKVRVDADKTFDFSPMHSWAWSTPKPGSIMVARTADDDPDALQREAEPVIMEAVLAEMPGRGLTRATAAPDLAMTYYLLLTVGATAQTVGQFLPPVTQWGIPPFTPSTQSLKVIHQGSLVLDMSANGKIVWRGVAEAEIKTALTQERRADLIRQAVREILKRYPPKK